MHPPIRDQADIGTVNITTDASNTIDNPDMTDQSGKDEADINYMLSRFGITQPRGAPTYGQWDDTIDLQQAIESVRLAKFAFDELPKELRDKFPNMAELVRAVDNGSLVIKDKDPEPVNPEPATP